jgi:hypothetical protein
MNPGQVGDPIAERSPSWGDANGVTLFARLCVPEASGIE